MKTKLHTPARFYSILTLEKNIFGLKIIVKSGLENFTLKSYEIAPTNSELAGVT